MTARVFGLGCLGALPWLCASCGGVTREVPGANGDGGGGAVGPDGCAEGFADCNGDPADGCEADLDSDAAHCGACERDCRRTSCSVGICEPEVLAGGLYFARRIALDTARVYWTSADGTVNALPIGGGGVTTLAGGQDDPWDVAVDEQGVYWTNSGANTVMAEPLAGGIPALLAEAGNPFAIAAMGGAVYFSDTYSKVSDDEFVMRVPLPAGPAAVVAETPAAGLIAVDAERVFWTDAVSHAVWSAPVTGGNAAVVVSNVVSPAEIEVDAEAVYFTSLEGTFRAPREGGEPTALAWGGGLGLASDAMHVYVGAADGRLLKVPKAGGGATVLARGDTYPGDIAVDGESVYWIAGGEEGALLRVAK